MLFSWKCSLYLTISSFKKSHKASLNRNEFNYSHFFCKKTIIVAVLVHMQLILIVLTFCTASKTLCSVYFRNQIKAPILSCLSKILEILLVNRGKSVIIFSTKIDKIVKIKEEIKLRYRSWLIIVKECKNWIHDIISLLYTFIY